MAEVLTEHACGSEHWDNFYILLISPNGKNVLDIINETKELTNDRFLSFF